MARMAMVSGLSSETGGRIGAASFISADFRGRAPPLSYGGGVGGRVRRRRPASPSRGSLIRRTSPATFSLKEKGKDRLKINRLTQRRSGGLRGGAAASR